MSQRVARIPISNIVLTGAHTNGLTQTFGRGYMQVVYSKGTDPMFDHGMYCKACGQFDGAVRCGPDGLKTCGGCGARRWSTAPGIAPIVTDGVEPIVAWTLTDRDRLMLIHFGIELEGDI